jgi:flagellar hook protein FlgE
MLGTIFIGLSGMNAFSQGLRQISNNISNINSTGFKTSNLLFSDHFSGGQRSSGSGQGVSLTEPRLDFAQGELRQSDRDLDLAVDGQGFLVLLKGGEKFYVRTGSFEVDAKGNIVLAGGDHQLTVLNEAGVPVGVNIDALRTNPPKKTSTVKLAGTLDASSATFTLSDIKVYDALGAPQSWSVEFTRNQQGAFGEWSVKVKNGSVVVGEQALKFLPGGQVDPLTRQLTFEDVGANRSMTLDLSSGVDSLSGLTNLRVAENDGFGVGELTTITVNDDGVLELGYSNAQKKQVGAVVIASLRDPQRGGGLFVLAHEGGEQFLTSKHERVGRVVAKRLEASNTDLSREFGDLILVQRGYQASSQVVSVSNDMIQQLFGIRGQG